MDALDKFVFAPVCHPTFDIALKLANYAGAKTGALARATSSIGAVCARKRMDLADCVLKQFILVSVFFVVSSPCVLRTD